MNSYSVPVSNQSVVLPNPDKIDFPIGDLNKMIVYTPQSHPSLPWDKISIETLGDSLANDTKASVIIRNGTETIKRNINDNEVSQKSSLLAKATINSPNVCYDYLQTYPTYSLTSGTSYGLLQNRLSCSNSWSKVDSFYIDWDITTNGLPIKVYIGVYDPSNGYSTVAFLDVTNLKGSSISNASLNYPVRYAYKFAAIVQVPPPYTIQLFRIGLTCV